MGDYNMDIAVADLDELTDVLGKQVQRGGPSDNKSVLWVLKGWDKVATMVLGGNYHRRSVGTWIMDRDPSNGVSNRARDMLRSMEDYQDMLEKHHIRGGDYFDRADKAVMNFAWGYRKGLKGKKENEYVHELQVWLNLSEDKMMEQEVFNGDRSL